MAKNRTNVGDFVMSDFFANSWRLGLISLLPLASFTPISVAEESSAEQEIEEILVTATKRTQNLKDVPITINVLSGDDIAIRGLESGDDIARSIPGMLKTGQGRSLDSSFLIRGIGTGSNPGTDLTRPTAVYLDDIPITSNNAGTQPDFRLFDIERVEVLKGPQGTLFGAGTLSGVVRVIANKADPSAFDYSLGSELASTGGALRHRYNVMVNVPLADNLAFRIAGAIRDEDGYLTNIGANYSVANGDPWDLTSPEIENSNSIKDEGLRASVVWDASERFSATLNYLMQTMEGNDYDIFNPETGRDITGSWLPHGIVSDFENVNLTLEYDFGFATLTSSTNNYTFESTTVIDLNQILLANPNGHPWAMHRTDEHDNFVQELRLASNGDGRFNYVVGYFKRESDNAFDWIMFTADQFAQDRKLTGFVDRSDRTWTGYSNGLRNVWSNAPRRLNNDTDEAFFAEITYDITDTVTVALGARSGELSAVDTRVAPLGGSSFGSMFANAASFLETNGAEDAYELVFTPNSASYAETEEDVNTFKASVMWQATDNINLFALASEGFRGSVSNPGANTNGGVSIPDPTDVVIPAKSNPDSLWNYEVGMKARFLDGTLGANVSYYYIDWEGFQYFARRRSDASGFTTNVTQATSKGLEAEFVYLASSKLDLGLNLSLIDAEISDTNEVESFMTGGKVGDSLITPDFSAVAFAQYVTPWKNGFDMFFRGDVQYTGAYPNAFPNVAGRGTPNSMYAETGNVTNVNFSVGISNDNWRASLFGENIFDNDDPTNIDQNSTFEFRHRALIPRTFGLRLNYKKL